MERTVDPAPRAYVQVTGSLSRRMIVIAACWIMLLLAGGGFALDRVLTGAITRNFDDQLDYILTSLIVSAEIDNTGQVTFSRQLSDQRFIEPYSGLYWQVSGKGFDPFPSRSLWDRRLPADDLAEEAFIVLREALRRSKKVGLGQLALRGREYVVSLKPCGRGMVLETLRYADEVNKAQSYFREIPDAKPDPELLDLAQALIDKKSAAFDPQEFHDRYVDALKGLIERKRKSKKGARIIEEDDDKGPSSANVVDLMAALKKSMEKSGGTKPAAKKAPAKKSAARKRA